MAVVELRRVVGDAHVLSDEEAIELHGRALVPWRHRARAIVSPSSREEVAGVLSIAREHKLPVWTFSGGKNWGYGTTNAAHEDALIMLLGRMNRIVEVNEELAYAVLEPGVTQQQLYDHLAQNHPGLWMDCTDSSPLGSVVGNALERGVGYTPYGDHFGHLCGIEAVLADGSVVKTGGPERSQIRHTYKWGVGPYVEGLLSQSNFGVVTEAGVWLLPAQEAVNMVVLEIDEADRFGELVDRLRPLLIDQTIGKFHCFDDLVMLAALQRYPYDLRRGARRISDETREEIRRDKRINAWTFLCGIYGTKAVVAAKRRHIRRAIGHLGRLQFIGDTKIAAIDYLVNRAGGATRAVAKAFIRSFVSPGPFETFGMIPEVYKHLRGEPGDFMLRLAYFKNAQGEIGEDPARDRQGAIWFAPATPISSKHLDEIRKLGRTIFDKFEFEFANFLLMLSPRTVAAVMPIFYNAEDPEETERARSLYMALADATSEVGYPQYRTGIAYMPKVLGETGGSLDLCRRIKNALDPDGVLAPGRYGIS